MTDADALQPLPIGYFDLHPDVGVNFQLNRFYGWVGEVAMLNEMRTATAGISDYPALIDGFLGLSAQHQAAGNILREAAYLRIAEFFLGPDDERKQPARQRFIELVTTFYEVPAGAHSVIPYRTGALSAYRFTPEHPRGTVVVCGGFDSYIEEWLRAALLIEAAGYDVILFEGPGQGTPLEDFGLHFAPDWHLPVGAVHDFYGIVDTTLVGFSMGGGLVLRAAAYEERVRRVVSYGIMTDILDVQMRVVPDPLRRQLHELLASRHPTAFNDLFARAASSNLLLQWATTQGRHVTGQQSPFDICQAYQAYETASVSPLITQDVLLLHGNRDHYVPNYQLTEQVATLTNARSVTARVFTAAEEAQNHCQVGNYGLALAEILRWLDGLDARDIRMAQ